jgi:hypothetical protein
VVDEITKSNGKAVSNYDSAIDGDQIIQTAIKNFKRIDVLINNFDFGCLDKSFLEIEDSSWDSLIHASIAGMYKVRKSNWLPPGQVLMSLSTFQSVQEVPGLISKLKDMAGLLTLHRLLVFTKVRTFSSQVRLCSLILIIL